MILKVWVPALRGASEGKLALLSLAATWTVSFAPVERFQFASTALTVTLKAVPAVCALAVPLLPVAVPAAALSPGIRTCSLAKAPAFTATEEPVLAVIVP